MTVAHDLAKIVDAAQGADWSTRQYLKGFAQRMHERTYNLAHHAFCFRQNAEDFRRMAQDEKAFVSRDCERLTARMYDEIATLFEKHTQPVVCGELCGFVFDGKGLWGTVKREPCACSCHRNNPA